MLSYYIRLALQSFRRTRGITLLMAASIALGIAISVVTVSLYHALAGNPIWWKGDRLYAVTMDNWPPSIASLPIPRKVLDLGPSQLTYRDAVALFAAGAPEHKIIMYRTRGVLARGTVRSEPVRAIARVTTADFFDAFDVPFRFGGGWNATDDRAARPVVVLSKAMNDRLFGGANSVGRVVRWNDHDLRIVGVLDDWLPRPKFYDINNGPVVPPEDAYLTWGWGLALQLPSGGNTSCLQDSHVGTFKSLLASECQWVQMWVELPGSARRDRMQAFVDNYWLGQHRAGRFPRPRNNRLTPVGQWLRERQELGDDEHLLLYFGFFFFAVCVVNVVGLVLAKFLGRASSIGVRRALGASRSQIVLQHLVEAGTLAAAAAIAGLAIAEGVLWFFSIWISLVYSHGADHGGRMPLDAVSFLWAALLAFVAAIAAGLYPALRVGRLPPAAYLKSQ